MAGMIYDAGKIRIFENLRALCAYAGEPQEWCDALWGELLSDEALMGELTYYMRHQSFRDEVKYCGYTLTDLYFWQMEKYNLLHDTGKNTAECRKTDMVLRSFDTMAKLKKEPQVWLRRLGEDRGMDRL